MKAVLRSELRKLLTLRSTYSTLGISVALVTLLGIVAGYNSNFTPDKAYILSEATHVTSFIITQLTGIMAIMMFANEYRYNTIIYTVTSSNRRYKCLVGKVTVAVLYASVFSILAYWAVILGTILGVHMHGDNMQPQDIQYIVSMLSTVLMAICYALAGTVIVALCRSQSIAITIYFLFPLMIENLLGVILKQHARYLPFRALSEASLSAEYFNGYIIFLAWMVAAWTVAYVLFERRDVS